MRDKTPLLITCKGIRKNGKIENCQFIHHGNWGDEELTNHQQFHDSSNTKNSTWLGFDTSLSYGKYSGRDGKQS